jgi:hypothetical protein
MNTHKHLTARRAELDAERYDPTAMSQTHSRLLSRLEMGEGATWQEVIEAPVDAVWESAAASAAHYYRHLPDVREVVRINDAHVGQSARYTIERNVAGVIEHRVGELLVEIPCSLLCVSDLDAADVSLNGVLPTIYALSIHEHPTERAWTVIVLAGASLRLYNPWILPTLGYQCRSIRAMLEAHAHRAARTHRPHTERIGDRAPIGAASMATRTGS